MSAPRELYVRAWQIVERCPTSQLRARGIHDLADFVEWCKFGPRHITADALQELVERHVGVQLRIDFDAPFGVQLQAAP